MEEPKDLITTLKNEAERIHAKARRNYYAAYAFNIVVVGSSITATILAATKADSVLTATFAVLPAAILAVNTTFNFERKASWFYEKYHRIDGLGRSLKYESAKESDVSAKYSELQNNMQSNWIVFGIPDTTNKKLSE